MSPAARSSASVSSVSSAETRTPSPSPPRASSNNHRRVEPARQEQLRDSVSHLAQGNSANPIGGLLGAFQQFLAEASTSQPPVVQSPPTRASSSRRNESPNDDPWWSNGVDPDYEGPLPSSSSRRHRDEHYQATPPRRNHHQHNRREEEERQFVDYEDDDIMAPPSARRSSRRSYYDEDRSRPSNNHCHNVNGNVEAKSSTVFSAKRGELANMMLAMVAFVMWFGGNRFLFAGAILYSILLVIVTLVMHFIEQILFFSG